MYFILIFRERSIINRIILVFRWDVIERIFLVNYLQKTHQGFFFASITLCFFINIPWNCLNSLCISWIHLGMSLPFHRNSDFTNPNESQALVFLNEPPPTPTPVDTNIQPYTKNSTRVSHEFRFKQKPILHDLSKIGKYRRILTSVGQQEEPRIRSWSRRGNNIDPNHHLLPPGPRDCDYHRNSCHS